MAPKTPFTFSAVSYLINKSGDDKVCYREKIVFEQTFSQNRTYKFRPVKRTAYMTEAEQAQYDRKMMEHAGEILSSYLSADGNGNTHEKP